MPVLAYKYTYCHVIVLVCRGPSWSLNNQTSSVARSPNAKRLQCVLKTKTADNYKLRTVARYIDFYDMYHRVFNCCC